MSASPLALGLDEPMLGEEFARLARAYAETQAFVSLLAHELRTQMKAIEWSLRAEAPTSATCPALESARSVQQLAEGLLELARGGDGERADADVAARHVVDELDVGDAEVTVGCLPFVPLPRVLLETILRNLIVNALEAGATKVDVYSLPDGTICVHDNGPGVPPGKAEQVFGVYSGKAGGAGLGLALCREILRRRDGDIWLELPSTFAFRVR